MKKSFQKTVKHKLDFKIREVKKSLKSKFRFTKFLYPLGNDWCGSFYVRESAKGGKYGYLHSKKYYRSLTNG